VSQNPPPFDEKAGVPEKRPPLTPDWREIAERASNERDPKKLIRLVKALCDRLEELHAEKNQRRRDRSNGKSDTA
jgi:hypothetical protein